MTLIVASRMGSEAGSTFLLPLLVLKFLDVQHIVG